MRDLREAFLSYFDRKGHHICASTALIPEGDPSLLFTSAGMVPFKPYFLGLKKGIDRATSCQKCFRTTDIERVGTTLRHLTFFEMLGNFSFGDYFKADAINFAWDFLTRVVQLEPGRLHPTVFREDDEAAGLWKAQGTKNPVIRLGEDSNFWAMGPVGPCGPCSEIYYDLGADAGCGKPSCAPGCDCDRYLEVWNLVFMQFERMPDGKLSPLPAKNIDTGMGLERLAMVVEGRKSPFETPLFAPIIEAAKGRLPDSSGKEAQLGLRVIADHLRASAMLAAEGIIPSNVERGYVLRRLIRRAARYGRLLGAREPFLHLLLPEAVKIFAKTYPELEKASAHVEDTLRAEEQRFLETLEKGERELAGLLAARPKTLPGEAAFKLYDTFGFPLELTREICGRQGVGVDEEAFRKAQEKASETARSGWKGSGEGSKDHYQKHLSDVRSEFRGYEKTSLQTHVVRIVRYGAAGRGAPETAEQLNPGDEGEVVLKQTPFYPEGGGQVGDAGWLFDDVREDVKLADVHDAQRPLPNLIVHRVTAQKTIRVNSRVKAIVDSERRRTTAYHHTATHLLNEALRRVLGPATRQAGSLVAPDRLRFDFTAPKPMTAEQIADVERIVNEAIRADYPVSPQERPAEEVAKFGAVTLVGEKYGDRPRFLLIGAKGWEDPSSRFSLELCGGTHVRRTGEIQNFKVVKESSVAAGIRRIEAVAGPALEQLQRMEEARARQAFKDALVRYIDVTSRIQSVSGKPYRDVIKDLPDPETAPIADVKKSLAALKELDKMLSSELAALKQQQLSQQAKMGQVLLEMGGFKLSVQKFEHAEIQTLRSISDQVKREMGTGVVFLGSAESERLSYVVGVTQDLVGKGFDAAKIARAVAAIQNGKAGGRADFAQGGGPDADWEELVNKVKELLRGS